MIPQSVHSAALTPETIAGRVLAHDVDARSSGARVRLRKGHILTAEDLPALHAANRDVHLLTLEPGDVHEDAAARRIAKAVAGCGTTIGEPHESQIALRAAHRGLLTIDMERLLEINSVPDMSVWTLFDAQIVRQGQAIAGIKATPLVTREDSVCAGECIARDGAAVIRVLPFVPRRVGVLVREELLPAAGERFREAISTKIGWFGSEITEIAHPANATEAIIGTFRRLIAEGADMILCAGVTSTDPLDLTVRALDMLGARWEKRGVPAHPGSTYWLAYLGDVPVLGMASCGMFSRATVLDLILPRFFAGEHVTARTLAALGHGGLLNKGMAFRFPDYASADIAMTDEE
jgi:hypothetical protein